MKKIIILLALFSFGCAAQLDDKVSTTSPHFIKECGEQITECSCDIMPSSEDYLGRVKDSSFCVSYLEQITTCSQTCSTNKPMWAKICYCD